MSENLCKRRFWYNRADDKCERLYTPKDKEAIAKARSLDWTEIDEDWAETEAGRGLI